MAWSNTLMSPFKPKGETAQWRIVYDVFAQATPGETLGYRQLADALDMDPGVDRHRIQAAARRAGQQLLEANDRAIETIPDQGYRVVEAVRQIPLAGQQIERAGRALDRGKALTTHVRMEDLTDRERAIVQAMSLGFSQVAEWTRQIGRRVEEHDNRLSDIEAELARLRERKD